VRRRFGPFVLVAWVAMAPVSTRAQNASVLSTVHNLSVSGPGEIRSLTEREVCKFCHVPHSAVVPAPLWGRSLSEARYATALLQRGRPGEQPSPQPDGSSRLCLSCHDGTIALGEVAGRRRPISMQGGADRLRPGQSGYLGTDLTGSHPISFVVEEPSADEAMGDNDFGLRPLEAIRADRQVRLDDEGKLQCTTCHDAHADSYFREGVVPHFWVKSTVEEVCLTCHALR